MPGTHDLIRLWVALHIVSIAFFGWLVIDDTLTLRAHLAALRSGQTVRHGTRRVVIGTLLRDVSRLASSVLGLALGLAFLWEYSYHTMLFPLPAGELLAPVLLLVRVLTMFEGISDWLDRRSLRNGK